MRCGGVAAATLVAFLENEGSAARCSVFLARSDVAAATPRAPFDERNGWLAYGRKSAADWLSWRIGMSPGIAREKVRVARALGRLPQTDEALRTAKVSFSKVRAMTRVGTPENEEELLVTASVATAQELERVCRGFRMIALEQIEGRKYESQMENRWVRVVDGEAGMVRITAQLRVEESATVLLALEAACALARSGRLNELPGPVQREKDDRTGAPAGDDEAATVSGGDADAPGSTSASDGNAGIGSDAGGARDVTSAFDGSVDSSDVAPSASEDAAAYAAERSKYPPPKASLSSWEAEDFSTFSRADALLAICTTFLERAAFSKGRIPRCEVFVQVQRETLEGKSDEPALLGDGSAIGPDTARRLSCDAATIEIAVDDIGNPLDIGRRTRTIPRAIQKALAFRDKTCRFPGCAQSVELDAHHVKHWAQGGATRLSNLLHLCSSHHWWLHEGGCAIREEAGEFVFFDPAGRRIEHAPPLLPNGRPGIELLKWLDFHGPGAGISLPVPIRNGERADWSITHDTLAMKTYGCAVIRGNEDARPRMPRADGRLPNEIAAVA